MPVSKLIEELQRKASINEGLDQIQLYTGVGIITKISEFVIGFLSTIILVVIPIIVAIELVYINFPITRTPLSKLKDIGRGHVKKAAEFALRDAVKAVEEANTVKTGQSANLIYLKLKIKWIYLVMFCIALVVGGGTLIINVLMSMLSGLIDVTIGAILS